MNNEETREKFIGIMAKFTAYIGKYLPAMFCPNKRIREKKKLSSQIVYDASFMILRWQPKWIGLASGYGKFSICKGWNKIFR